MYQELFHNEVFGLIKPLNDVHTLGISIIANLLKGSGYKVEIASAREMEAVREIKKLNNLSLILKWIRDNKITRLGFSYRLDPNDAESFFSNLYTRLKAENMLNADGGQIKGIFFAGLPDSCERIKRVYGDEIVCFPGDEPPLESLHKLKIPVENISDDIKYDNQYDKMRWDFAKSYIESEKYLKVQPADHWGYPAFGRDDDNVVKRITYARTKHTLPLTRVHAGPYSPDRNDAIMRFIDWTRELAEGRYLDILSIGSSQLTQSNFGEKWEGLSNGGGVPVNSELEYNLIYEAAKPMLVRTYAGTKNVPALAQMHQRTLNIAWHALSFWWFCEIDGRGGNTLLQNLKEHFQTLRYIASTGKPLEPNVPHHFAFRGADDISYIISGFLCAKAAKISGINHLILQIMLNNPKYTWGVQDLAKARVLLTLVRELEDDSFHVYLQPRAGLDYFSPDIDKAKVQLAAVTALIDDIEPENSGSPEIIHVVSYSEAVRLATPPVMEESIKITLGALEEYRRLKKNHILEIKDFEKEITRRFEEMIDETREAIQFLENKFSDLYTPEGFYKIFRLGFFPLPYLMDENRQFTNATSQVTALKSGGIRVIDEKGNVVRTVDRYRNIIENVYI